MPKQENSVYLYRNGIADFRRVYDVAVGGQKVSIPVQQDQIGDVLASIDYFGKVKLTKPPGYSPVDSQSTLTIDAKDPMFSALRAFSGARISLTLRGNNADVTGTLIGCEVVEEVAHNGVSLPHKHVSVYTEDGLQVFDLKDDIKSIKFLTDADKAEFDKALARNYQKIKPGSTFIDLTLTPTSEQAEEVILQYALPVAAWNMSYRLRRDEKGSWTLDGHAVVHNSTDFDWQKFWISVVTGEPTTFQHDLAEAKLPARSKVNVTAATAHGAVNIEEGVAMMHLRGPQGSQGPPGAGGSRGMAKRALAAPMAAASGHSFAANFSGAEDLESVGDVNYASLQQAEMDMAEASTVGDFMILKSPNPADIGANQSALVPMFSKPLSDASRVFYYKPTNDPSFPFSAVKFKNTTDMPLTKGVVTVTIEGHNAGEAVLEAAKPGDTRLLAHTLETGIKIVRDKADIKTQVSLVRINEGHVYTEQRSTCSQEYTVKNKLEEETTLLIEHPWNIHQSDVTVKLNGQDVTGLEKLSTGVRFTIKCKASDTCTIVVAENKLDKSTATFDASYFLWISRQSYFVNDENFAKVAKIQEEINKLTQEKQELVVKRQELQTDQARHNGFLPNAGTNKDRWEKALATAEDELVEINKTKIPAKDKAIQEAGARLTQALKDLRTSWQA